MIHKYKHSNFNFTKFLGNFIKQNILGNFENINISFRYNV